MRNTAGVAAGEGHRIWPRQRGGAYGSGSSVKDSGDRMMLLCRLQRVFAAATLALTTIGVVMIYWWVWDTRPPIEIIDTKPIQQLFRYREPIVIEKHIAVRRQCQGVISRSVVDNEGFAYPLLLSVDPIVNVGETRVRVEFKLPEILGPGNYRYREVARWRCNPLTDIDQVLLDVPFTVVRWGK